MSGNFKNRLALVDVNAYKAPNKELGMQIKNEVIDTLRTKVKEDPKASAVFHVWALRERNRHNMTTRGLYYKMRKEGFLYQQKEYADIFNLLAELGLVKLEKDSKGNIESIREFKLPIQAIGQIACGQEVNPMMNRPTLMKVPRITAAPVKKPEAPQERPAPAPQPTISAVITVYINNKPIQMTIPKDLTADEVAQVLTKFR